MNYLETRTKADDGAPDPHLTSRHPFNCVSESPNNDEGHSSQSRDHHAAGKVLDTLKAQDNTGKSSQKAKDVTHARNEHPEDAEAVSREEADLTDDTVETVEKVDLEALDAVHSNPEQGAVTGSSSAHKQGKDSLLPPNTVPSTMHVRPSVHCFTCHSDKTTSLASFTTTAESRTQDIFFSWKGC